MSTILYKLGKNVLRNKSQPDSHAPRTPPQLCQSMVPGHNAQQLCSSCEMSKRQMIRLKVVLTMIKFGQYLIIWYPMVGFPPAPGTEEDCKSFQLSHEPLIGLWSMAAEGPYLMTFPNSDSAPFSFRVP